MSTDPIHLVVGDSRPVIYTQLREPDAPLDISAATVTMTFKAEDDDFVYFFLTGELLPGTLQQDLTLADLSQFPVPGSGGRVRFRFVEGNLNLPPGRYVGEIAAQFGPGSVYTVFTRLRFLLRERH